MDQITDFHYITGWRPFLNRLDTFFEIRMAATGIAPISLELETPSKGAVATDALLTAMLRANPNVSDLVFSPGRTPQVEVHGKLIPVQARGGGLLTADDTRRIASDLIGNNKQAITILREQGSCDISYGLAGKARFRANIFIQRGSCAIVMRVISGAVPDFASLRLPAQLADAANLRDGIILVSGPRGSGKSSTLAALVSCINRQQACHIVTIEDPIEFLHSHKLATIHQRELHSDTPSFAMGLRAALRQAPRVILVGEMRDRETTEMVLEAAETGHLVLSSVNSTDAIKTIERVMSAFSRGEQPHIRLRLAKTFRFIIAQRLIPRKDGTGRVAAFEILRSDARTVECMQSENRSASELMEAIKDGEGEGMPHFDGEIAKLVRDGIVDADTAMNYATDPRELEKMVSVAKS
jgi:twitching motility protein PilT